MVESLESPKIEEIKKQPSVSKGLAPLDEIEEVKTYRPTEEQFKEPMKYVEYLYHVEHAHKYGIVKIIPPESFRPALAFDTFSPLKLPTRY